MWKPKIPGIFKAFSSFAFKCKTQNPKTNRMLMQVLMMYPFFFEVTDRSEYIQDRRRPSWRKNKDRMS